MTAIDNGRIKMKEGIEVYILMISVISFVQIGIRIGREFGSFEKFFLAIISKIRNKIDV